MTRIMGTLQEDVCTFVTVSRSFLFRMRNVSDKNMLRKSNYTLYVQ